MQIAQNQISPSENFDLSFFIRNPLDATTYYVRAKLYDVRTGELLNTVSLVQSSTNSRLFTKTVQAPPDPSGYGRNIAAIASVYTDSGFTSQSQDYEEQEQYFLIKAVAPMLGGGVDYHALRDMMDGVVAAKLADQPQPNFPFDSLFGAIGALQREINRVPKELVDTTAFAEGLTSIRTAIAQIPEPKEPDLSAITEAMNSLLFDVAQLPELFRRIGEAISSANQRTTREFGAELTARIETKLREFIVAPSTPADELDAIDLSPLFGAKLSPIQLKSGEQQVTDVSHLMN